MENTLTLAHQFAQQHPMDAVRVLERRPPEELVPFLEKAPAQVALALFNLMDINIGARCLEQATTHLATTMVAQLPLERAVVLMRRLNDDVRASVLQELPPASAESITPLLRYSENTAGALVNPRILTLPPDINVQEALKRVHAAAKHAAYYLYVVERDQSLSGVVNMRELMSAPDDALISSIMRKGVIYLPATASLDAVFAHPGWLEFHTLPVVDEKGRFVGTLRNKILRQLASQHQGRFQPAQAGAALGELYRIGLSGLLQGTAETLGTGTDA